MSGRYVAGVDGAPGGWIAVIGDVASPSRSWLAFAETLAELWFRHPRVCRWAIDMPLGLESSGYRTCDLLARESLGVRRSSVFFAPPCSVVDAFPVSYRRACKLSECATGKKLSKQTFNLVGKIHEVRNLLASEPRLRSRAFETHPELSFMSLNGGRVLLSSKKTKEGLAERTSLLKKRFGADALNRFTNQTKQTRGVSLDDTIDAAACWTSAARAESGDARMLPESPPTDAAGLPIAIRF